MFQVGRYYGPVDEFDSPLTLGGAYHFKRGQVWKLLAIGEALHFENQEGLEQLALTQDEAETLFGITNVDRNTGRNAYPIGGVYQVRREHVSTDIIGRETQFTLNETWTVTNHVRLTETDIYEVKLYSMRVPLTQDEMDKIFGVQPTESTMSFFRAGRRLSVVTPMNVALRRPYDGYVWEFSLGEDYTIVRIEHINANSTMYHLEKLNSRLSGDDNRVELTQDEMLSVFSPERKIESAPFVTKFQACTDLDNGDDNTSKEFTSLKHAKKHLRGICGRGWIQFKKKAGGRWHRLLEYDASHGGFKRYKESGREGRYIQYKDRPVKKPHNDMVFKKPSSPVDYEDSIQRLQDMLRAELRTNVGEFRMPIIDYGPMLVAPPPGHISVNVSIGDGSVIVANTESAPSESPVAQMERALDSISAQFAHDFNVVAVDSLSSMTPEAEDAELAAIEAEELAEVEALEAAELQEMEAESSQENSAVVDSDDTHDYYDYSDDWDVS